MAADRQEGGGEVNIAPPLSAEEQQRRFKAALASLKLRRRLFFAVVILYMPFMGVVNRLFPGLRNMVVAFGIWFLLLFVTAVYSALARCPSCGKSFHLNGMSLLYLRRCLHCQMHISGRTDR